MATQKISKGKGLYLHVIPIRWRRRLLAEVLRVEEETLGRGLKDGGKEELGEEE